MLIIFVNVNENITGVYVHTYLSYMCVLVCANILWRCVYVFVKMYTYYKVIMYLKKIKTIRNEKANFVPFIFQIRFKS